jgi:hypothetical protein
MAWHKTWVAQDSKWRETVPGNARAIREQIEYRNVVKK